MTLCLHFVTVLSPSALSRARRETARAGSRRSRRSGLRVGKTKRGTIEATRIASELWVSTALESGLVSKAPISFLFDISPFCRKRAR